jgi:3-dehydroquinate synthase
MNNPAQPQTITVGLGKRSYPIMVGKDLLPSIGADLAGRAIGKRYGIVSDDHVARLYAGQLKDSLTGAGLPSELLTFPRGEASKNLGTIAELASELARRGFDRLDALIALGGGVTGDIAGFLASIYMRGIAFVQVPSTLLAQVDSSVGGKTGVDIPEGKNLVGTFCQPRAVYADTALLSTLPEHELLGGLAEVIKYTIIADADFFAFLQENRSRILDLEEEAISAVIIRCCEIKARVVEQDEREGGLRRVLNYGHTIGHAIEAASDFSLIHGLAVAMGMCAAADLAVRAGILPDEEARRIRTLITSFNLPVDIPAELDRRRIKSYLKADKKTVGGRVYFVLPTEIGKVVITDNIRATDIDAVLR